MILLSSGQRERHFALRVSSVNVTKSVVQIWSRLLKKSLMENFIFCAMRPVFREKGITQPLRTCGK